jgi:hypothetical protein
MDNVQFAHKDYFFPTHHKIVNNVKMVKHIITHNKNVYVMKQ